MLTAQCFSVFHFRVEGSEVPSLCTVDPEARAQPELVCFSLGEGWNPGVVPAQEGVRGRSASLGFRVNSFSVCSLYLNTRQ